MSDPTITGEACAECGAAFRRVRQRQRFCSTSCRMAFWKKTLAVKRAKEKACPTCGKPL